MAVKDVKEYYYKMFAQYLEMKNDLADFEEALKNGFITEEKLAEVKDTVNSLELNYQRLLYVALTRALHNEFIITEEELSKNISFI